MLNVLSVLAVLSLEPSVPLQRPGAPAPSPTPTPPAATDVAAAPAPVEAPSEATPVEAPSDAAPSDAEPTAATPVEATTSDAASDAPADAALGIAMPIPVAEPPTPESQLVIDLDVHERALRRWNMVIAGGAVIGTIGVVMAFGAFTEARKAPCKFDLETCPNAPRPTVTRALAAGAAVALIGGGVMVVAGVVKRRRIQTSFETDLRSAGISISGRF